ncbi:DUF244 domain-containing protein, partial [Borreliella valaisiana]
ETFIKLVEDLVERSDFYRFGIEFDWAREFVEYVDSINLEIENEQTAANLERSFFEIDNLKLELNKIQNENRKREKP